MALADSGFARALGPAAVMTSIVGPPRPGARFAARFRRAFGHSPGPWAPYGEAAMRRVLRAVSLAGERGNRREAVVAAYLSMPGPGDRLALWQPAATGLRWVRALPPT
jgi:hypothetical protein